MINSNFVILGALIATLGELGYLLATLKGEVRPNRVSFLLWSLAPLIAFVAEIKEGVGLQALMTFLVGFFPLTIFTASFVNKQAEWHLRPFDLVCGGLSLLGLLFWYLAKSSDIAILFSILADGLAALPTVVKAFNYPETEIGWTYFTATISAAVTLLTIKVWNLANAGFPLYILTITLIISSLAQFKIGKRMKAQLKYRHDL